MSSALAKLDRTESALAFPKSQASTALDSA